MVRSSYGDGLCVYTRKMKPWYSDYLTTNPVQNGHSPHEFSRVTSSQTLQLCLWSQAKGVC